MTAPSGPRAGASRVLTTIAIGILVLDGVLLLLAGWDQGRVLLMGGGLGSLALAGVMHWVWRRHRRLRVRWPSAGIASLLEGGYCPDRLADGVMSHLRALGA